MRNAKTRLLSLVLAVIMVVSMLPATVLAEAVVGTGENETPRSTQRDGEIPDNLAVTYSDATATTEATDTTNYFVDSTLEAADTTNHIYPTMQAAVEAAFAQWNGGSATASDVAMVGSGTITLHQDYDMAATIPATAWSTTAVIGIRGGEHLILDLNGNTLTNTSGTRLFGYVTSSAANPFYLEVKDGTVVSNGPNGAMLHSSAAGQAGTAKFINCDMTYTGAGTYGISTYASADCHIYLIGGTYRIKKIVSTKPADCTNVYLDDNVRFYVDPALADATYAVRVQGGKLYLLEAEIYTTGTSTDLATGYGIIELKYASADKIVLGDGTEDISAKIEKSAEMVYDYDNDGTPDLYKHTITSLTKHVITTTSSEDGNVAADKEKAFKDDTVTLTVTPDTGYELDTLTVDGEAVDAANITEGENNTYTYTFTMPDADVTVSATFTQKQAAAGNKLVNIDAGIQNGTVLPSVEEAAEGATVTLTVTPDTGYEVGTVTVTGASGSVDVTDNNDGTYTFTMPDADVTVTVTFKPSNMVKAVNYKDDNDQDGNDQDVTYYTADAANTDYNTYTTMQAAVEAAFKKWAETGEGTITLHQDYTISDFIVRGDVDQRISVGEGQQLTLDLNEHTLTNTSERIFGLTGTNADKPAYLEVINGNIVSTSTSAGAILRVESGATTGTVKFRGCDVSYTYSGSASRSALSVTSTAPVDVYVIGGTFKSLGASVWLSTNASSITNLYLQDGVQVYTDRDAIGNLRKGSLYLEEAVIYTMSENVITGGEIVLGDGVSCYTVESEELTEGDYTYKHTLASHGEHTVVPVAAKDATCTEAGNTAGTKCSVCDKTLSGNEEIPATDHAWGETTYVWGEDADGNVTCTATRACDNDATHVGTETVIATENEGTYTATFEATWATAQTKDVEGVVETPEVKITLNGLNLRLQDLIKLGFYFKVETEAEVKNVGALLWTDEDYTSETNFTVSSTLANNVTATTEDNVQYAVETEGIYAQNLDTTYYIVPYVELVDGGYVYSEANSSSALVYANIVYNSSDMSDTRSLVIDLLNYATAARKYFCISSGEQEPTTPFNDILIEEDRTVEFNEGLKGTYPSVSETTGVYAPVLFGVNTNLLEAIKLNLIFQENVTGGIGYWTESEYLALNEHNRGNMTHEATISIQNQGTTTYTTGSVEGLYSYDMYKNFFFMAYNESGECSRTYGLSVAAYLGTVIDTHSSSTEAEDMAMVALAKAMLVYGNNALTNPDVNKGN